MHTILCFGDSITFGEADSVRGGWCDRLKRYFFKPDSQAYLTTRVYNLGVAGDTSDGLVNRFESEFMARALPKQNTTVIFQYGINDIVFHKNKNRVPPKYFQRNLSGCFEFCRARKASIVVLPILSFAKADDGVENCHGHVRYIADVKQYNECLKSLTSDYSGQYIELNDTLEREIKRPLAADGLHPSDEAHQLIYDQIKEALFEKSE
ncbi:hypothetical protein FLL45_03870 [Aliikangiella marina]|uniref:SGNH hydrolase-type esterase domain-containing protein n=1 Tax=Aliikangiella marina TaxID=1712262 RepID=A0A545TIR0_9GAMM|nr:SGNH/GDSL hydrolase family protein [Aliikangiella marina]TQV77097.1 hypothetical protein FLL45_03870 [Aliikangiella marina]